MYPVAPALYFFKNFRVVAPHLHPYPDLNLHPCFLKPNIDLVPISSCPI